MNDVFVSVSENEIDEAAIRAAVDSATCGALVMFHGIVRNHDGGKGVTALDYKAHPEAEEFLRRCVQSASERSGLRLAAAHRVGALQIGDVALVAAASASHRREAFAAIAELVEDIKSQVPIWKRQYFSDGVTEWVGL